MAVSGPDEMESPGIEVAVEDEPDSGDLRRLVEGLVSHNGELVGPTTWEPLAVFARRDGELVGGASGDTEWGWLHVRHLWVAPDQRRSGLGRSLMSAIEAAAGERGCRAAWLDTFSFQAPAFYAHLGYREFGRLDDYPPGSRRHFLYKEIG